MISSNRLGRRVSKDVDKALANIGASTPMPDMKDDGAELKAAVAPKKAMTFGEAFRAARKDPEAMKRGTFTFGGKSFSTKMAGEGTKATAPRAAAPKAETPKATADVSESTRRFVKGLSLKPKPETPRPAAQQQQKARPKSTVRTGRDILGSILDTSKREKEIARGASKPRDYAADRAKMKAQRLAEKAARRKELGIREPGKAKGGRIDGAAIRGKTRAMKKGK